MTEAGTRILTAYRTPERVAVGRCPMCDRDREVALDITVALGAGLFETWSVCDECAPRATRLLGWLAKHLA